MKSEDKLRNDIWVLLEENTSELNKIPLNERKFDWEDMANLRGAFRKGPNNSPAPIDSFDENRLKNCLSRLQIIRNGMFAWRLNKRVF